MIFIVRLERQLDEFIEFGKHVTGREDDGPPHLIANQEATSNSFPIPETPTI